MKNRRYFFLLVIPLILGVLAGVVMLVWNATLPDLFPVPQITYWQAFGLLLLCRILFGDFRWGGRWHQPRFYGPPIQAREKWMNMSEEEKIRFKEEWRRRCEPRKP